MYYSKVIREEYAGANRRRCVIEKPVDSPLYVVKAIFRCPSEEAAQQFFDFLIKFKGPPAQPLAPAPKRGRKRKTEDNHAED